MQKQEAPKSEKAKGTTRVVKGITQNAANKLQRHVQYLATLNGCPEFLKGLPKDPSKKKIVLDGYKKCLKEFYKFTDSELVAVQGIHRGSMCGPQKAREYLQKRMVAMRKARLRTHTDKGPIFPLS